MFERFFEATAWTMVPPKAYGAFHIVFTLTGFAVCALAAWLLRRLSDKGSRVFFLTIGSFLVISELYKILFQYYVVCNCDINHMWWLFPFQLCSAPIYLCFIVALTRSDFVRDCCCDFMLAFNLFSGFVVFFEPSGLVHEYWTLTIHAFVWHLTLVLIGLYLAFSGRAGKRVRDYRRSVCVFLIFCVTAFAINLIFRGISQGSMNNFYIGPSPSPLIVFKDISTKYGWLVNDLVYIPCICTGAFLFFLPVTLVNRKRLRKAILSPKKQISANKESVTVLSSHRSD